MLENATPPGEQMQKNHCYNWDSHAVNCHIFDDTQYKLGFLDQSISALIEDLYTRGLNRRVLLVVTGEFGRTPKVEYSKGTQKVKPFHCFGSSLSLCLRCRVMA